MERGWIQGVMFQALFTDDLYFHGPPRQRNGRPPPGRAEGQGWTAVGGLPHQPGVRRGGQRPQAPARRGVRLRGLVPPTGAIPWCASSPASRPPRRTWTACSPPCPTCTELLFLPRGQASGKFFCLFRNQTAPASYILIEPVLGEEGDKLDEITLAKKLRQGSRLALERAIDRFTPYVSAVVVRVLAGRGAREDVEN